MHVMVVERYRQMKSCRVKSHYYKYSCTERLTLPVQSLISDNVKSKRLSFLVQMRTLKDVSELSGEEM